MLIRIKNIIKITVFYLLVTSIIPSYAQDISSKEQKLKFNADVRFRIELDRESHKSDGSLRTNRDRTRVRLRLGFIYKYDNVFSFGGRIRTGAKNSAQSPHVTLGDQLTPKELNLDKAFIKTNLGSTSFWVGKNSFPFEKQNEFFWDSDVNPEGIAFTHSFKYEKLNLKFTAGHFFLDLPTSSSFKDQSSLSALQLSGNSKINKTNLEAWAGLFSFKDNPNQIDSRLQDLNYNIGVFGGKISFNNSAHKISFGVDLINNFKNYSITLFNNNQKKGYVINFKVSNLNKENNWLFAYYYAYIEKYAVVPFYSQDDWIRWGSSTETRSSNFKGHELRFVYALSKKNNFVLRIYIVDGINKETSSSITKEDGNRIRFDWNIGF